MFHTYVRLLDCVYTTSFWRFDLTIWLWGWVGWVIFTSNFWLPMPSLALKCPFCSGAWLSYPVPLNPMLSSIQFYQSPMKSTLHGPFSRGKQKSTKNHRTNRHLPRHPSALPASRSARPLSSPQRSRSLPASAGRWSGTHHLRPWLKVMASTYPLVICYITMVLITMFLWENPLFLWQFSSSLC